MPFIKSIKTMLKCLNRLFYGSSMKRFLDLIFAVVAIIILSVPFLFICLAIRLTSEGSSIYWSDRVCRDNIIFRMPKFRSMRVGTPAVATHLLKDPERYLTPIGSFLRKSSLDELPQLWSILRGDMSFVGPRPALFNQDDLIKLRTDNGVNKLLPGITGWAQVNGRDELSISEKVELDVEYMNRQSFWFDMKILWMTFLNVIKRYGISH
jgi:O-antigen biosynthesis protein WbqP